ncbi:hypothetical protein Tco_0169029 [Tanacetum coccineum]
MQSTVSLTPRSFKDGDGDGDTQLFQDPRPPMLDRTDLNLGNNALVMFVWDKMLKKLEGALQLRSIILLESLQDLSCLRKGKECLEVDRVGNMTPGQANLIMCYNCKGIGHLAQMIVQNQASSRFRLLQRQIAAHECHENGAVLDKSSCCFLQTIFMANLSSEIQSTMRAGHHLSRTTQSDVQHNYFVDSDADIRVIVILYRMSVCRRQLKNLFVQKGERGFEQTKRCYLTEVIPFFKTLKEHFVGVQTALVKEVKVMEEIFDQMNNEVDKNTVDKQCAEIEKKNLLIEMENMIVNCLSIILMYDVAKITLSYLEADLEYLNLQLKYQHLQESFDNKKSQASQEAPDFRSFFKIKNLEHQIQEKDNVIRHLKDRVANVNDRSRVPYNAINVTALVEQNDCYRVELEKVKQHYKELYDSIKSARVHTSEKTSTMLNEIESLKAQLRSKEPCFTSDYVKPKVLAPGMYAIDVKPIPHPLKNNRSAHLNYVKHLKESVETVREIVEEARVVKPLDNSLNYACQYTKLSQELLECVIGTCPKSFNERDNKAPSTPVTRKLAQVVQIILRYLDSSCSKLDLEEEMNGSSVQASVFIVKRRLIKSVQTSFLKDQKWRLLASLQAPFLKEKKGVRFSALYLQQKRNLLVLDHSHQQVSVVKWINVDQLIRKGNLLLDLQKLQMNPIFRISVDIFVRALTTSANVPSIYIQLFWNTLTHDAKTGVYSFQVDEHWLTLSADLLRKALNVTPADSAHPFESPPAGKTDITFTRRRVPSNWLMKMKFNRLLNLIWMIMSTIYNKTSQKTTSIELREKAVLQMYKLQSHSGMHKPKKHVHGLCYSRGDYRHLRMKLLDLLYILRILHHKEVASPVFPQGVAAGPTIEDTSITQADLHPSVNPVAGEPGFAQSTSGDVSLAEPIPSESTIGFISEL